jgi:hypothetical protein
MRSTAWPFEMPPLRTTVVSTAAADSDRVVEHRGRAAQAAAAAVDDGSRTATRCPSEHPDRSRAYRMRLDFAVVGQAGRRACTEDLCTAYEQVSGKTEIARTFSKALGQGAREAFELTACSHGATGLSQPTSS